MHWTTHDLMMAGRGIEVITIHPSGIMNVYYKSDAGKVTE